MQRATRRAAFAVGFLFCAAHATGVAIPDRAWEPPETLTFTGPAPTAMDLAVPDRPWEPPETVKLVDLAPAIKDPDLGRFYLFTASRDPRPALKREDRFERISALAGVYLPGPTHASIPTHVVYYPPLSAGDIFPVFEHLYLVSSSAEAGPNTASARRVTWEDLPRGTGSRVSLWTIPLAGVLEINGYKIHLKGITEGRAGAFDSATLSISHRFSEEKTIELGRGGVSSWLIGTSKYRGSLRRTRNTEPSAGSS